MEQTLITKIAKAGQDVGGKLKADKTNKEQNYDYLSADKILSDCGQALFTQGVVIIPDILAQEITLHEYTDAYGKAKKRYDARVDFIFHIADETTSYDAKWYGVGSDYSVPDKSLYKAITSGHKYFLMKLLCIGAGNEDAEHEEEPGEKKQKSAPSAPPNGKSAPESAPATTSEPVIYTGQLAKLGGSKGHNYPQLWVKAVMTNLAQLGGNEYHVDGVLQKLNLPQSVDAEAMIDAVNTYLRDKTDQPMI